MGATVVKVEPPQGDSFRGSMDGATFAPSNHGKQSLCVDLKTDAVPETVPVLSLEADVFIEGFRTGVLELERVLLDTTVPAGAVKTIRDIVEDDPHVEAREVFVDSYNPETDESVTVPALSFRIADGFASVQFIQTRPGSANTPSTSSLTMPTISTDCSSVGPFPIPTERSQEGRSHSSGRSLGCRRSIVRPSPI